MKSVNIVEIQIFINMYCNYLSIVEIQIFVNMYCNYLNIVENQKNWKRSMKCRYKTAAIEPSEEI